MKKLFNFPAAIGWRDHVLGGFLGATYVAWLLITSRTLGFARDEGFYFRAATDYARWFRLLFEHPARAFERANIDSSWATNHEHPALMKSLFALSWMFLHEKWKIFTDASTAFRFPGMVMAGIALWLTYMFAARVYSRRAGIIAAVLLGLMPRVFYNAHLACFDVPILTMWMACIYVYWRSETQGGLAWAIMAGAIYGLTLETKHNAWLLPAVFLVHAVFVHGRQLPRYLKRGTLPLPTSLVMMAVMGPLIFWALWPWIWNDPLPRIQEYMNFHLNHEYYTIEFLHVNYFSAPSPKSYMPVMLLATVPSVTLLLFLVGAQDRARHAIGRVRVRVAKLLKREVPETTVTATETETPAATPASSTPKVAADKHETDLLLLLAMAVPLAVFLLPKTPIFGGTKHWIPAYPFLCIFAGRGFDVVADKMMKALEHVRRSSLSGGMRLGAQVALGISVTLGPLLVTAHSHPFGLSSYVPFAGGTAGAADLGLNRQFWGFTTQSLASYFAAKAPIGSRIYICDTAWDSWARLVAEKRLRPDLRAVGGPGEADFAIVHHELHMGEVDFGIWSAFHHLAPDMVLTHDGVPIISVYKK